MNVKLLTEHRLEFLSIKECYTGSSESTLVKMPYCWKSHVGSKMHHEHIFFVSPFLDQWNFHKAANNKVRMVHCIYLGVTGYNLKHIVFLSLTRVPLLASFVAKQQATSLSIIFGGLGVCCCMHIKLCHLLFRCVMIKWYELLHYKENHSIYWLTAHNNGA